MGQRDILLQIVRFLNKYKIPYLLTGSFAVSYYGYPRSTHDIDFILEVVQATPGKILQAFKKLDRSYSIDWKQTQEAINRSSQFDIYHPETGVKVDFWIIGDDRFDQTKFDRKRKIVIKRQEIQIISPEDLLLTKLLWCQKVRSDRHLRDCVGIVKIQGEKLDRKYLATWVKKLGVADLLKEVMVGEY